MRDRERTFRLRAPAGQSGERLDEAQPVHVHDIGLYCGHGSDETTEWPPGTRNRAAQAQSAPVRHGNEFVDCAIGLDGQVRVKRLHNENVMALLGERPSQFGKMPVARDEVGARGDVAIIEGIDDADAHAVFASAESRRLSLYRSGSSSAMRESKDAKMDLA